MYRPRLSDLRLALALYSRRKSADVGGVHLTLEDALGEQLARSGSWRQQGRRVKVSSVSFASTVESDA